MKGNGLHCLKFKKQHYEKSIHACLQTQNITHWHSNFMYNVYQKDLKYKSAKLFVEHLLICLHVVLTQSAADY